jgi:endoplasmic reticulum-Golgi intermediate compartment protein 3
MSSLRQRRRYEDEDSSPDVSSSRSKSKKITLESFDLYTKVVQEDKVQTSSGGSVSLFTFVVCVILVLSELVRYFTPIIQEHMVVDPVIEDRLQINFDITFPSLECSKVNLDAMDVAGEQQNGVDHDILKTRLSPSGKAIGDAFVHVIESSKNDTSDAIPTPIPENYCGPCYGAEVRAGQCCNTCDDVRNAYNDRGWNSNEISTTAEQCKREQVLHPSTISLAGEGCRIAGYIRVNKVAGNFHIAFGETHTRGSGHIHQFNPAEAIRFNVSHIIHKLSFGDDIDVSLRKTSKQANPLDNTHHMVADAAGVWMYWLKVIPTIVYENKNQTMKTNQYSVTSQYRPVAMHGVRLTMLPGVFIVYEISPFQMSITKKYISFLEIVTSLLAILGGILSSGNLFHAVFLMLQKRSFDLSTSISGSNGPQSKTGSSSAPPQHQQSMGLYSSPQQQQPMYSQGQTLQTSPIQGSPTSYSPPVVSYSKSFD